MTPSTPERTADEATPLGRRAADPARSQAPKADGAGSGKAEPPQLGARNTATSSSPGGDVAVPSPTWEASDANASQVDQLPERIARKVQVDPQSGCWLWQGGKTKGYGSVCWEGKQRVVHRLVYNLLVGPIPDGLTLDHVAARGCTNRHCCNPAHLEAVTNKVNILRGSSPSAVAARKTHCFKGHEFTPENTSIASDGKRICRICQKRRDREKRRRKAAASGRRVVPKVVGGRQLKLQFPRDLFEVIQRIAEEDGITAAEWMRCAAVAEVERRQNAAPEAVA